MTNAGVVYNVLLPALPSWFKVESFEILSQGACSMDGMESSCLGRQMARFPWLAAKLSGLDGRQCGCVGGSRRHWGLCSGSLAPNGLLEGA
ncbi:hypothetical protein MKX08_008357 [Trichoderma sp. CBMAI-0020]|nr:hypothetical protein MKX08_008357 [Trichoderma sp. CBMAI-0020]